MKKRYKHTQMNFEIPADLRSALHAAAKLTDCSASQFIRNAVREKLYRIERTKKTETPLLLDLIENGNGKVAA